jgi:hypothetical protein
VFFSVSGWHGADTHAKGRPTEKRFVLAEQGHRATNPGNGLRKVLGTKQAARGGFPVAAGPRSLGRRVTAKAWPDFSPGLAGEIDLLYMRGAKKSRNF